MQLFERTRFESKTLWIVNTMAILITREEAQAKLKDLVHQLMPGG